MRPDRRLGMRPWALAVLVVALAACAEATTPYTPPPTLDAGKAATALDGFAALIKNPALSMHVEQTTSITVAAVAASRVISGVFNYRMDVSGADFAATVFFPRSGVNGEVRRIAGIEYVRVGSGAWATTPIDPAIAAELVNPWQCLGPLTALRLQNRTYNPREAFIFGNSGPIEYLTLELREQGYVGSITSLRLVVRSDGIPVDVTFNGDATSSAGTVQFASTVSATRVGETITIAKPVP